jgi:hypothetical protein
MHSITVGGPFRSELKERFDVLRVCACQEINDLHSKCTCQTGELVYRHRPVLLLDVSADCSAPANPLGELLLGQIRLGSLTTHIACNDDTQLGHGRTL